MLCRIKISNFPLFWASCDKQTSVVFLDDLPNHVQTFRRKTNNKLQRVQIQYGSLNYQNVSTQPRNVKVNLTPKNAEYVFEKIFSIG